MLETETIEIDGIDLEVSYHYDEGMQSDDYDVPNDLPSVDIEKIEVKGVDIYDIIDEWVLSEIADKIIKNEKL